MRIHRTRGIVLDWAPVSETSRIVSWLTPDRGRLATLVKGSQRPKSFFLGQYDHFYTCDLVYYDRPLHTHLAKECFPLKLRPRFRSDWKAAATASYMAGLILHVSPPEVPAAPMFRLCDAALDHLGRVGAARGLVFWLELQVLQHLGWAPQLQRCLQCGGVPPATGADWWFAPRRGGLLCPACRGSEAATRLTAAGRARLAQWQQAATPQQAGLVEAGPHHAGAELEAALGGFLDFHVEHGTAGRRVVLDLLRRPSAHDHRPS